MEAETDGMKSAALWRGSPGAKILLSHIPTNPTRRLGSLSHHSKDPHGCPPPPPLLKQIPPLSLRACEPLTTPYRVSVHVCIRSHISTYGGG